MVFFQSQLRHEATLSSLDTSTTSTSYQSYPQVPHRCSCAFTGCTSQGRRCWKSQRTFAIVLRKLEQIKQPGRRTWLLRIKDTQVSFWAVIGCETGQWHKTTNATLQQRLFQNFSRLDMYGFFVPQPVTGCFSARAHTPKFAGHPGQGQDEFGKLAQPFF